MRDDTASLKSSLKRWAEDNHYQLIAYSVLNTGPRGHVSLEVAYVASGQPFLALVSKNGEEYIERKRSVLLIPD